MKFALHFANTNFPDAAGARRLAVAAEAAGFESLLVIEHVVWPTRYESTYPYSPTGRLPGGPETLLPDNVSVKQGLINSWAVGAAKGHRRYGWWPSHQEHGLPSGGGCRPTPSTVQ